MEQLAGDRIDKGDAPVANDVGQARGFAAPQDLAEAVHYVGAAIGVAESLAFFNGQLHDEGPDVRLAVAVGHTGELGQGPEPDRKDAGISLIGFAGPVHRIVNGLFGQGMSILNGNGFSDPDASPKSIIECT